VIRTVSRDVTGSVIRKKAAKTAVSSNGAPGGPTEAAQSPSRRFGGRQHDLGGAESPASALWQQERETGS